MWESSVGWKEVSCLFELTLLGFIGSIISLPWSVALLLTQNLSPPLRAACRSCQAFGWLPSGRTSQSGSAPAFRALDAHDLQRGAPDQAKTLFRVHFVCSTCAISAEGHVSRCSGGTASGLKRESKEEREVKVRCRCENVKISRDVDERK